MASRLLPRTVLRSTRLFRPLQRPSHLLLRHSISTIPALSRSPPLRRSPFRSLRFNSTSASASPPKSSQSITARLRSLSKEYGYSAVGVYLALSVLDFPICFLTVRMMGTEKIGAWEDKIVGFFKTLWVDTLGLPKIHLPWAKDMDEDLDRVQEEKDKGGPSIWTELALAYAIHKSIFIFVRVPLTAAITPKVVKVLRGWGWDIGKKGRPKISMPPTKKSRAAAAEAAAKAEKIAEKVAK